MRKAPALFIPLFLAALLIGLWMFLQSSSESTTEKIGGGGSSRAEAGTNAEPAPRNLSGNNLLEEQASVHRETENLADDVASSMEPKGIPLLLLHEN